MHSFSNTWKKNNLITGVFHKSFFPTAKGREVDKNCHLFKITLKIQEVVSDPTLVPTFLSQPLGDDFCILFPFDSADEEFPVVIFSLDFTSVVWIDSEIDPSKVNSNLNLKRLGKNYTHTYEQLKKEIFLGNIYELNLCEELSFNARFNDETILGLWKSSGCSSHFFQIENYIISYSPEIFCEGSLSSEGWTVRMEPMKGTIPKSVSQQMAIDEFNSNQKLVQELRLITDLCRNDLASVGKLGTLKTTPFLLRETSYAWQAVSSTEVMIQDKGLSWLPKLLPAASITGAPKGKVVKFLREYEGWKRGYYTGVMGVYSSNQWKSSVLIRTLFSHNQSLYSYGTGGGIIWESRIEDERSENELKASFLGKIVEE